MSFTENTEIKNQRLVKNPGNMLTTKSQKISERHKLNIIALFYWTTVITLKNYGKTLGKY